MVQWVLLDAGGSGILALNYPECRKFVGRVVPGAEVPDGRRIPGLAYRLDPVQTAVKITCMNPWRHLASGGMEDTCPTILELF